MVVRAELELLLQTFVHKQVLGGRVLPMLDEELLLSGMIDSMGVMVLLDYIEQDLDIGVPFEDVTVENFGTVSAIANYLVEQKTKVTSPRD